MDLEYFQSHFSEALVGQVVRISAPKFNWRWYRTSPLLVGFLFTARYPDSLAVGQGSSRGLSILLERALGPCSRNGNGPGSNQYLGLVNPPCLAQFFRTGYPCFVFAGSSEKEDSQLNVKHVGLTNQRGLGLA